MKTGIFLSYRGLGANLLHLTYCHQIAKKFGPVSLITLCPNLDKAFLRPDSRGTGSYQVDMFGLHSHKLKWVINGGGGSLVYTTHIGAPFSGGDGMESVGGTETRPKNIAVLPLIHRPDTVAVKIYPVHSSKGSITTSIRDPSSSKKIAER